MNKLIILSVILAVFVASSLVIAAEDIEAKHQIIGAYSPGSTLEISNTFTYSGNLLSLLWRPIIPEGWTLVSGGVSGEGSPELQYGEIVWTGTLPQSPIEMKYLVQVPSDASGAQSIQAEVEYQFMGMANAEKVSAGPNPLVLSGTTNQEMNTVAPNAEKVSAGPDTLVKTNQEMNKAASNKKENNCWEVDAPNGSKVMRCAGLLPGNNETAKNGTEKNMTCGQCVSEAAKEKNSCYNQTKTTYRSCKDEAKNSSQKNAAKQCSTEYKGKMKVCKSDFKTKKTDCIKQTKPGFFERARHSFK